MSEEYTCQSQQEYFELPCEHNKGAFGVNLGKCPACKIDALEADLARVTAERDTLETRCRKYYDDCNEEEANHIKTMDRAAALEKVNAELVEALEEIKDLCQLGAGLSDPTTRTDVEILTERTLALNRG